MNDATECLLRAPLQFLPDEARPNPALLCAAAALRAAGDDTPDAYEELLVRSGCAFHYGWLQQPGNWSRFPPVLENRHWDALAAALGRRIAYPGGEYPAAKPPVTQEERTPASSLRVWREAICASLAGGIPVIGWLPGSAFALCAGYRQIGAETVYYWKTLFRVTEDLPCADGLYAAAESCGSVVALLGKAERSPLPAEAALQGALQTRASGCQTERTAEFLYFRGAAAARCAAEDTAEFVASSPELAANFAAFCLTNLHWAYDARAAAVAFAYRHHAALAPQSAELLQALSALYEQQVAAIRKTAGNYLKFTTQSGLYEAYDRLVRDWTPALQEEFSRCFARFAEAEERAEALILAAVPAR